MPLLKNLDTSVLKGASLRDITAFGNNKKMTNSKFLSQTMTSNFEHLQNFPENIPAGSDDCTGHVHMARFLRGYVGDGQDLWVQARKFWGPEGIPPICNYEVVSMGLGDLLSHKVWEKIHRPKLQFLTKFVDEAVRSNARNWEEKKTFLSHQDLCVKWTAQITRKGANTAESSANANKFRGKPETGFKEKKKVPTWVCRSFNDGKCASKDDRHPSDWNPNFFLKHVCNRWVSDKNKFCLEAHKRTDHK